MIVVFENTLVSSFRRLVVNKNFIEGSSRKNWKKGNGVTEYIQPFQGLLQ